MIYQLLGRSKQGISNRRYCTGNRITYSFLVATKDGRQMTKEEGRPHQTHCQCQNRPSKQYRGALPACVRTRPHALRIPYCTRNTSRSIYRYIMYSRSYNMQTAQLRFFFDTCSNIIIQAIAQNLETITYCIWKRMVLIITTQILVKLHVLYYYKYYYQTTPQQHGRRT